jgi:hypothetical protein
MVEHGARGIDDHHHIPHNDAHNHNRLPDHMNEVVCEVGDPPRFENIIQDHLRQDPDIDLVSENMATRCLVWERALQICRDMANEMGVGFLA